MRLWAAGCNYVEGGSVVPKEILKINRIPPKSKQSKQVQSVGLRIGESGKGGTGSPSQMKGNPWQLIRNSVSCADVKCAAEKKSEKN